MKKRIYIFIALLIFSIIIRLPFLNRPMAGHFEWLTAHTALTLKIWEKEGIAKHHFAPVYTWKDQGNFPIGNLGTVEDDQGRMYYISYPAAGFWFPYFTGQIFQIQMSVAWIQIWNLMIHGISTWLLADLIFSFFGFQAWLYAILWALFLPIFLWFFGNVYFIDMQAQGIFVCWLWLLEKFYKNLNIKYFILALLCLFALVLTEWIGLFAGVSWIILDFWLNRKFNFIRYFLIVIILFLGLAITIFVYSSIAGFDAFYEAASSKFLARSGTQSASHTRWEFRSYFYLTAHYFMAYGQVLASVSLCLIIALTKPNFKFNISKPFLFVLLIACFPVLMHHFVFFNFAAGHFDFPTIKLGPFILLGATWIYALVFNELQEVSAKRKYLLQGIFSILIFISIPFFWFRNSADSQHLLKNMLFISQHTITNEFEVLGLKIKKETSKDETPALLGSDIVNPQINWYSERNVVAGTNIDSILARTSQHQKIKVFRINDQWACDSVFVIQK